MLTTAEAIDVREGVLQVDLGNPAGWRPLSTQAHLPVRQLRVFLGDPRSGPLVWMFNLGPAEYPVGGGHHHRSDSFRITVGDQPEQYLFRDKWYGPGEYRLDPANLPYGDEGQGSDGALLLLMFADRRGAPPIYPEKRSRYRSMSETLDTLDLADSLSSVHATDADAVTGIAATHTPVPARGFTGSVFETEHWQQLSDGSTATAFAMGDPVSGPVVIMSDNAANAQEPDLGRSSDTLRLVIRGSCALGSEPLEAFGARFSEAGHSSGMVVHGPTGSTQLLLVSDRRALGPSDDVPATKEARARLHETHEMVRVVARAAQEQADANRERLEHRTGRR